MTEYVGGDVSKEETSPPGRWPSFAASSTAAR